ncbi:MAG: caspase domain-containing protein [Planctomycetaceae bacterium]
MKPISCFLFAIFALLASTETVFAQGRKLAVVVGVNAYRPNSGLPALQHADSDATKLSAALRANGFTVYELTHEVARQPGKETLAPNIEYIRDAIEGMLEFPNLGREDSILVALHGHGVQFEEVKTVKKNGKDEEERTPKFYFCPADATISGIKIVNDLTDRNHLLPLEELYEQLAGCKATTKLLIVDACRNDPTQPGLFREGLASATLPKLPPPTGGTAAFFSCKSNQRAVEDPALQQGVFTHFLVQGLLGKADLPLEGKPAGDGVITLSELSAYVGNNTYAHVYEKYKVKQSPELRGDYDLNLPLARVTAPLGTRAGDVQSFTSSREGVPRSLGSPTARSALPKLGIGEGPPPASYFNVTGSLANKTLCNR